MEKKKIEMKHTVKSIKNENDGIKNQPNDSTPTESDREKNVETRAIEETEKKKNIVYKSTVSEE